jgi:hypothetical protein
MLGKFSVVMMLLIATASLIGISSVYQYVKRQALPDATAQPQLQTQITGTLVGKIKFFALCFF